MMSIRDRIKSVIEIEESDYGDHEKMIWLFHYGRYNGQWTRRGKVWIPTDLLGVVDFMFITLIAIAAMAVAYFVFALLESYSTGC